MHINALVPVPWPLNLIISHPETKRRISDFHGSHITFEVELVIGSLVYNCNYVCNTVLALIKAIRLVFVCEKNLLMVLISPITMTMVHHKSYISMGRNFNNILKYNVLSSNFGGYLKLLRVI